MDTGEQLTSVFEFLEPDGESQITYYVVANVANEAYVQTQNAVVLLAARWHGDLGIFAPI